MATDDRPAAAPTPTVARTPLLTAVLDGPKTIERVEIMRVALAPHQRSGLHLHPCPVVGVILSGSIVFQRVGEPARLLRAGDAFFEPAHVHIAHFDAGEDGATFAVHYLLGPAEQELITFLS